MALNRSEIALRDSSADRRLIGLGFEAAHERGLDSLDFHEVSVVGAKRALQEVWGDGYGIGQAELLKILRRLVAWNDDDLGEGVLEDVLHEARGAIAKAEG